MSRKRWHLLALLTAAGALAVGMVTVPANAAGGVSATFGKGSDWGTGYEGKYTIANNSGSTLATWTVEFDLAAGQSISSLWDGSYTVSGQHITVKNTWNGNVGNGASANFGFNVKYSGTYEQGIEDYKVLKNSCPATGTIAGTAYAKCGGNWWSYDTPSTIGGKMSYAKSQGLGGAFFWELTGDTTNGELITAMKNGLG